MQLVQEWKHGIGHVVSSVNGAARHGTGFAVSDRLILTAYHVVGDRLRAAGTGVHAFHPGSVFIPSFDRGRPVRLLAVDGCCDPVDDWALFELAEPVAGLVPLPLGGRAVDTGEAVPFVTWGYPSYAALAESGVAHHGTIRDWNATFQSARALQLFCDNLAAGSGDPINGLSGAPCIAQGEVVGIVRSQLAMAADDGKSTRAAAGVAYACPLWAESLVHACSRRLPSLRLENGLPATWQQALPAEPFRHLHWYAESHAELYFGRDREVHELRGLVTARQGPQVVLLYGPSGVGKSSLLHAGLFTRIPEWEVRHTRKKTGESLSQALERTADGLPPGARDRTLLVIDQVEEVFSLGIEHGSKELDALLDGVLRVGSARVLLSFRFEWLAPILARFRSKQVPHAEMFLAPLSADGIRQVVRGVASTRRLRERYRMEVDPDLPDAVAQWLRADPSSPVAPILSITLARLWDAACAAPAGAKRLRVDDFHRLTREGLDLETFVRDQLRTLEEAGQGDAARSGLALDILYFHTTTYGATRDVRREEIVAEYGHLFASAEDPHLAGLLAAMQQSSLLYSSAGSSPEGAAIKVTRLGHDTLASRIRKLFFSSDAPGQRARRIIEAHQHATGDATLSKDELQAVRDGECGTRRLSVSERELIARSQQRVASHDEQAEWIRKVRWWARRAIVVMPLIAVGVTTWMLWAYKRAAGYELASKAVSLMDARRPELAIPLVAAAGMLDASEPTRLAIANIAIRTKGLQRVFPPMGAQLFDYSSRHFGALGANADLAAYVDGPGILRVRSLGDEKKPVEIRTPLAVPRNTALSLSSDGTCLAVADPSSRQVQVHPTPGRSCAMATAAPAPLEVSPRHVAVAARIGMLLVVEDGGPPALRLLPAKDGNLMRPVVVALPAEYADSTIRSMALAYDERRAAVALDSGDLFVLDLPEPRGWKRVTPHREGGKVNALALSRDGGKLLALYDNDGAKVWDARGFLVVHHPGRGSAESGAFSPDGRGIAVGWSSGEVEVLSGEQGGSGTASLSRHPGGILRVGFNADGTRVAAWSNDGLLRISAAMEYPVLPVAPVTDIRPHPAATVFRLDDMLNQRVLTYTGSGWTQASAAGGASPAFISGAPPMPACDSDSLPLRVRADLADAERLKAPPSVRASRRWSGDCRFFAYSHYLASGTAEFRGVDVGRGHVWRASIAAFGVRDVAYARSGDWLVATADEGAVVLRASTGQPLGPRLETGVRNVVTSVLIDASERFILVATQGELSIWPTPDAAEAELENVASLALREIDVNSHVPSTGVRFFLSAYRWLGGREAWRPAPGPPDTP